MRHASQRMANSRSAAQVVRQSLKVQLANNQIAEQDVSPGATLPYRQLPPMARRGALQNTCFRAGKSCSSSWGNEASPRKPKRHAHGSQLGHCQHHHPIWRSHTVNLPSAPAVLGHGKVMSDWREVRSGYGLRGVPVGEASHPGPPRPRRRLDLSVNATQVDSDSNDEERLLSPRPPRTDVGATEQEVFSAQEAPQEEPSLHPKSSTWRRMTLRMSVSSHSWTSGRLGFQ